jgi:hypothetical protein
MSDQARVILGAALLLLSVAITIFGSTDRRRP